MSILTIGTLQGRPRLRSSTLVYWQGRILTVFLEDPLTRQTLAFLPGGKIEDGESPAAAAVRETLEETGVAVVLRIKDEFCAHYSYDWAGVSYACITYFFIAAPVTPPIEMRGEVVDASYHRGFAWLEQSEAVQQLSHHAAIAECLQHLLQDCEKT